MPAQAQDSTVDADTEAIVLSPLTLVKDDDLDFGGIVPGNTRGFVTLNPDNTLTVTGGILQTVGDTQPAAFYGYGSFGQFVRINIDANRYFLTRVGGTERVRLDRVTIGSVPPTILGTVPRTFFIGAPSGLFRFTVGGRLRVGANQAPGVYEGEFDVTIEYL